MLRKIIKNFYCALCILLPHKKTIIFESGDNLFDNGFVLADYVANRPDCKKYKLICIGKKKNNKNIFSPLIYYFCYDNSFISQLRLLKFSFRSKYIFYSYDNYWKYIKLKKSTKLVYVTHGAFPIKNVSEYFDSMFNNQNFYYILCTTSFVKKQLELRYPRNNAKYFLSGMPRCDLLKNNKEGIVFDTLGIKKNFKIVIIACTFRHFDNPNTLFFKDEFPISLSENDICYLNKNAIEKNIVVLFKLHHAQFCNITNFAFTNIIFVDDNILQKNYISNFDLFNASSALITDYSGIFMDYLLTDKPLGFILTDKEKYRDERGFTIPNFEDYLPGEKILTKEELFNFIFEGFLDSEKFAKERFLAKNNFIGDYFNFSESLINEVKKI